VLSKLGEIAIYFSSAFSTTRLDDPNHNEMWGGCIVYLTTYQIVGRGRFLHEIK
jgi:hypothetical protein